MTIEINALEKSNSNDGTSNIEPNSSGAYTEETTNMLISKESETIVNETVDGTTSPIGTESMEMESSVSPPQLKKEYAISVRWEEEMEEYKAKRRNSMPKTSLSGFHTFFCCCAKRLGGMYSLIEKADGTPLIILGPCWPCCSFVTLPLILGIAGLVSFFFLYHGSFPIWLAILYLAMVGLTLCALSCVSCRNPGILERVTDEEAGQGGWYWNEQAGSFRPRGAMYCRECKALIEEYDHFCPWTGTGIGRMNMGAFKFFVVCVNLTCYFSIGIVSYGIITNMKDF